ncbi:MAG: hypothetical protein KDI71_09090 [Xanthomonadales bacterium]|nr:hypothetical protein [Xanthomonadales bacterium]
MSEAIYLVLEEELEEAMESGEAKSIARALKQLDRTAVEIGVTSLSAFSDGGEEEYEELAELEGWDSHRSGSDDGWYEANEALETVRALHGYVESDPEMFRKPKSIMSELEQFETILERAAAEGIRFKFEID